MKALSKLHAEPGIWLTDVEIPSITPEDVLIKIHKTAICGTDIHIYKWDDWAKRTIPTPMVVGHEFVGEIVELGNQVRGFHIGDIVSGEGHITCKICRNCRAGKQHLCRKTLGLGSQRPGAFAEYLALPASNLFKVPSDIPEELAAIFDPLGNATHTALSFDLVGEDVLVTGAGPIGIMGAAIARHAGARHVVITDPNPYRLALANKMGIKHAYNPLETPLSEIMTTLGMTEGFDVGLEMSGNGHAFNDMVSHMNNGGRIALLGILDNETKISWSDVIFKCLFIKGIYGREMYDTWYKMGSMIQSGLNIAPIITHRYAVDDFQLGFDKMLSGESGKVILTW